jgi:CDP-paratose 2-epimerase
MSRALVTGSGGLVGSETVHLLASEGWEVIGIDNDSRAEFFGPEASTRPVSDELARELDGYWHVDADIRLVGALTSVFQNLGPFDLIIHAAGQPSHDWAGSYPKVDFAVNAQGTLNLLEQTRQRSHEATFCFLSTNKVYGDRPNRLPLKPYGDRFDLHPSHAWFDGIDTSMSIDQSMHSLFGVSKLAADLLTQEYGRYFGLNTVCFRCGCITGPSHAGVELHGFLAYLMKTVATGEPYTVYGYEGRQVRDNISGRDVARACLAYHGNPRRGAVFNLGGGRANACSVLEAISMCEEVSGRSLDWEVSPEHRPGDHRWWITDIEQFRRDFPDWKVQDSLLSLVGEIYETHSTSAAGLSA